MTTALKYRPDIDGLRAVAVLSVIFYHLSAGLLPGGFVGVDIFFVISGYLISGIIARAADRGAFSYLDFYGRRVRRIFPSLLLVFLFALIFGWFSLFSPEYKKLGDGIFFGSIFSSNLFLLHQTGYFDRAAELKPFLHLWSLGVEEQFYLIWPLVLMLFRGRKRLKAVIAITAISFFLNLHFIGRLPWTVFYVPLTRLWELSIGCILALEAPSANPWLTKHRWARETASILGFGLILGSIFLLDRNVAFPGWRALAPTAGAIFMIAAGQEALLNRLVLSNPIAVFFGLISYPLYLWHWTLLYFVRVMEMGDPTLFLKLGAVGAAVLLAWLSYRYVETPIRTNPKRASRAFQMLLVANFSFTLLAVAAFNTGNLHHEMDSMSRGKEWVAKYANKACGLTAEWCFADKREEPVNALFGDSHADALYPGLVRTSQPGGRWMFAGQSKCTPLLGEAGGDAKCQNFVKDAVRTITTNRRIKLVLVAAAYRMLVRGSAPFLREERYKTSLSPEQAYQGLRNLIQAFQESGKTVAFLVDNPAITSTPESCFPRVLSFTHKINPNCTIGRTEYEDSVRDYRSVVNRLQATCPKLLVYDPTDFFCDQERCSVIKDGKSYYSYTDHMSLVASQKVALGFSDWINRKRHAGIRF